MFHECRARAIQQGFVDYAQLRSALAAREIADHRTVRGMLDGLERMLRGINLAVEAAFATYILLTLKDLEWLIISTSQDFHGIDSFDALMLCRECLGERTSHTSRRWVPAVVSVAGFARR